VAWKAKERNARREAKRCLTHFGSAFFSGFVWLSLRPLIVADKTKKKATNNPKTTRQRDANLTHIIPPRHDFLPSFGIENRLIKCPAAPPLHVALSHCRRFEVQGRLSDPVTALIVGVSPSSSSKPALPPLEIVDPAHEIHHHKSNKKIVTIKRDD
jgi:hypothetical protein